MFGWTFKLRKQMRKVGTNNDIKNNNIKNNKLIFLFLYHYFQECFILQFEFLIEYQCQDS
jgi:hypothetical protein